MYKNYNKISLKVVLLNIFGNIDGFQKNPY